MKGLPGVKSPLASLSIIMKVNYFFGIGAVVPLALNLAKSSGV